MRPNHKTRPLTHNTSSEADEPTQASSAGLRRSGTTIPNSAPAPQSAKIEASTQPSALMASSLSSQMDTAHKIVTVAAAGKRRRCGGGLPRYDAGSTENTIQTINSVKSA